MTPGVFNIHNAAEVIKTPDGGISPQRLPEDVRARVNSGASKRSQQTANTELRFFLPADGAATVRVKSEGKASAIIFFGDFQTDQMFIIADKTIDISVKLHARLVDAIASNSRGLRGTFHPQIVRICFTGDPVTIYEILGEGARPPSPSEVPARSLLCCGTSITHGCHAVAPHLSYPARVARLLGWDAINLGLRGSMFCESALADYIAGREDWSAAILELSVNMTLRFTDKEFFDRVHYFVSSVARSRPSQPVIVFSLLPHFRDMGLRSLSREDIRAAQSKRQILSEIVANSELKNLHFLDGNTLILNYIDLSDDLLHIGDYGFETIANGLYQCLRSLI